MTGMQINKGAKIPLLHTNDPGIYTDDAHSSSPCIDDLEYWWPYVPEG